MAGVSSTVRLQFSCRFHSSNRGIAMFCITTILRLAGPLKPGFQIRIENPPWKDLVIRDLQQTGPHGIPAISVAHYEGEKGTVAGDPEMSFVIETQAAEIGLIPFFH